MPELLKERPARIRCPRCCQPDETLPAEQFYVNNRSHTGRQHFCKRCERRYKMARGDLRGSGMVRLSEATLNLTHVEWSRAYQWAFRQLCERHEAELDELKEQAIAIVVAEGVGGLK